jgi:hypothetical protein
MKADEARKQTLHNREQKIDMQRQNRRKEQEQKRDKLEIWRKEAIKVDLPEKLERIKERVKEGECKTTLYFHYRTYDETNARALAIWYALKELGYSVESYDSLSSQENMGDSSDPYVTDVHRAQFNVHW